MQTLLSQGDILGCKSIEQVDDFFNCSPVALLRISLSGYVLSINEIAKTLLGLKNNNHSEFPNFFTNIHRDPAQNSTIFEQLQKNIDWKHDVEWKRPQSSKVYFTEYYRPVKDSVKTLYYEVTLVDNTELVKARRAFEISEEKYKVILDQLPIGLYRALSNGEIIFANHGLAMILGMEKTSSLIGHYVSEYQAFPDENIDFVGKLIASNSVDYKREILLKKADGREVWVQDTGKIFYDTSGEVLFYDGIIEEISARKSSEQELQRLIAAISQTSEGIVITDAKAEIIYTNPAFEKMTMYSGEEVRGKRMSILKSKQHSKEFYKKLWKTISSGNTWSGIITNARKNGEVYEEHMVISPVKDKDGSIVNFVSVKRDITEERKLEQQLHQSHKLQAIGTLAGGIAHDFNNILMGMQIYTEILLKKIQTEGPEKDILSKIYSSQNRAKDLIKQLLSFSRQSGDEREPLQIHIIVKEALKLIEGTFPANIKLQQKISDSGYINGNPTQIHQILLNLCTNAIHAMEGNGTLSVELYREESIEKKGNKKVDGNSWICLKVQDSGCGIEKKIQERIFDPFFTTKSVGEGTGLGLATVHGIVKQYGGEIKFSTELGTGTIFYIYLPAL